MKYFKFTLVLLFVSLFIMACNQTETTKSNTANSGNTVNKPANSAPTALPTAAQDEMASAKKIYSEKCASCHKEDGSGGKTVIEGTTINAENLLTDKMKKMSDEKYIDYIVNGIPDEGMPAFKGKLTDQEIKSVVAYIRKNLQGQ